MKPKIKDIIKLIENKVDKANGKTLTTNDFTNTYKTKLEGIEEGANNTIIENVLTSTSEINGLSAKKGKELNDKIMKFDGSKADTGYIELPNGLKLFWGAVKSLDFIDDVGSTKYKYNINLPVKCNIFIKAFATFQYNAGESLVGISETTLSNITLYSSVKANGFVINWFAIGS